MIQFVLENAREQPGGDHGNPPAPTVLPTNRDGGGARHVPDDTRDRQARLARRLFAFGVYLLGVSEHDDAVFDLGHHDPHALPDLGRGEA